jgi:hypothetical protein
LSSRSRLLFIIELISSFNRGDNSMKRKNFVSYGFRWIFALLVVGFSINAHAWNARFDLDSSRTVKPQVAHNWIVYRAMQSLEENGLLHGMHDKMAGEGFTPYQFISFGLWYADHVYKGIPENKNGRIVGVNEAANGDSRLHVATVSSDTRSPGNDFYRTEVRYLQDGKTNHNEKVNLYLQTRWRVDQNIPFGDDVDLDQRWAADNVYHFANDRKVETWKVHKYANEPIFGSSDFGAVDYGAELYILAQNFLSSNIMREPQLNELTYYDARDTGKTYLDELFDSNSGFLQADYPSFYVGGNPFVCGPVTKAQAEIDACAYDGATWPFWVPDKSLVAYAGTSEARAAQYRAALMNNNPGKYDRAALIYLGWALHMLGDLSMPEHAVDRVSEKHEDLEDWMDRDIIRGAADPLAGSAAEMNALINQLKMNLSEVCESIGASAPGAYRDADLVEHFNVLKRFAFHRAGSIHGSTAERNQAYRELVGKAAVSTAALLGCFFNVTDAAVLAAIL